MEFFEDKTFDKIYFSVAALAKGEYDHCTFKGCDFSNADLSGYKFIECEFIECNLSLAKINDAGFRDVKFMHCKLMGMLFNTCNGFGLSMSFQDCNLRHASFYQRKMKGTQFKNCKLQEADFSECDLTGARFEGCDLQDATFENTILEKADLRTSYNYSIHPAMNKIKKAKFSLSGIAGLVHHFDIEIDPGS